MSEGLGGIFGDAFGSGDFTSQAFERARRNATNRKPDEKPLPQIRGKEIDGVLYVRAVDVADALHVLSPTANKRLIDKLRGYVR